jgi:3-oxoadipate enol-lactonase
MTEGFIIRDGVRLRYAVDGNQAAPPVVLLNSIGTGLQLWDDVIPHLASSTQILRSDARGHGGSAATEGIYSLDMLAHDLAATMDDAGIFSAVIAGNSLGGMVAMQFACRFPRRTAGLVLICTSAQMDRAAWQSRYHTVSEQGIAAIADLSMERFFSADFRKHRPEKVLATKQALLTMDSRGYAGCAAAIRDMDLAHHISTIACPTLVVTGRSDISTPLEGHGEHLLAAIPGAQHLALDCGHLAPLECPAELAAAMARMLNEDAP